MAKEYFFDKADQTNAFITRLDVAMYEESGGPLQGKGIGISDNISTSGIPTTCASRILAGYVPPFDAHVITLLRKAGAAIVGKTNMDEFGAGNTTEHSAYGPTTNPYDASRVAGGSSGGSAAAVATGMVDMALGSDTGGSIRSPAAFCGVVGFKPTNGRVSRYGLIAYSSSMEQIGPLGKTVTDVNTLMSVIAGPDPRDATMYDRPYAHTPSKDIAGMKIAVPDEFFGEGVDPAVAESVRTAIRKLEDAGAETMTCSIPSMSHALAAHYVTGMCEASTNLSRFDGVRFGPPVETKRPWHEEFSDYRGMFFGKEVQRRILLGTFALTEGYYEKYYAKAQVARENMRKDFLRIFRDADIIAGPTMPQIAPKLGEKSDPISMYLADILTAPASLAGVPAISVPCGTVDKMPVGLQLIGRHFEDERVMDAAFVYESEVL